MFMPNKLTAFALACSAVFGQEPLDPKTAIKFDLPKDSPVAIQALDPGDSKTYTQGGARVLDIHTALTLRNIGGKKIQAVTLLVRSQEKTPGGKASVSVASVNANPNESFPVRIDLRLLRPIAAGAGPLLEVQLDGILFDDLSFYGENRLNSHRSMVQWELEARRDRKYFRQILESKGADGLRAEMIACLGRQDTRPQLNVQMVRDGGRATNVTGEKQVEFSFLRLPDSPIDPLAGSATVLANEAKSPSVDVRNTSGRAVRYLEVGWIVRDRDGKEYYGGSTPAEVTLNPGGRSRVVDHSALKFSGKSGQPLVIDGITGFVNHVEFADGGAWVPARTSLAEPRIAGVMAASAEEQRLVQLYRKKGLQAVVQSLTK